LRHWRGGLFFNLDMGRQMTAKKVYEAIASVTASLAKEGISKDRKNEAQGYKFRGIDDVYNALAPFLAGAKLCILPNVQERLVVERVNAKGTILLYVTVKVDFAFVSAEDGSEHHVVTYGEAMDSGDKATNKAMSAAYKYAAMQAFCIPTEGDNDADSTTHTLVSTVDYTKHLLALAAAPSMEDLQAVFKTAYKSAQATQDTAAMATLTTAKNKRKEVLQRTEGFLAEYIAEENSK
jgi:hypothetical protein